MTCRPLTCLRPLRATRSRAMSSIAALMSTPVTRRSAGAVRARARCQRRRPASRRPPPPPQRRRATPRAARDGTAGRRSGRISSPNGLGGFSARLGVRRGRARMGHNVAPLLAFSSRGFRRDLAGGDPTTSSCCTPAETAGSAPANRRKVRFRRCACCSSPPFCCCFPGRRLLSPATCAVGPAFPRARR